MFAGKDFTPAQIQEVQKDGPAYSSGIKIGDIILSINNKKVNSILDVSTYINTSTKENIDIKVLRNNDDINMKFDTIISLIKNLNTIDNPLTINEKCKISEEEIEEIEEMKKEVIKVVGQHQEEQENEKERVTLKIKINN